MSFEVGNSQQVLRPLLRGRIDLGFIEGSHKATEFGVTPITLDYLVTVVAPGHPWPKTKTSAAAELARTPPISREKARARGRCSCGHFARFPSLPQHSKYI